jgi:hypothetical protein
MRANRIRSNVQSAVALALLSVLALAPSTGGERLERPHRLLPPACRRRRRDPDVSSDGSKIIGPDGTVLLLSIAVPQPT